MNLETKIQRRDEVDLVLTAFIKAHTEGGQGFAYCAGYFESVLYSVLPELSEEQYNKIIKELRENIITKLSKKQPVVS